MTSSTLATFVQILRDYQLLSAVQLDELPVLQARFADSRALARELVRRGWLTAYQANQLVQGKAKNLVLGPYRLLERLGEGAMGQVFKARHLRMQRVVALKIIAKERLAGANSVQRFEQEVRAAAQLSHPNIVNPDKPG
jgi:serine/threonine protein kinase